MKPTIKKATAIVLLALVPLNASAGLSEALNEMFMMNATSPQAYNSQTRGGLVGGGLVMRAPVQSINLVALDPMRFSVGCAGIDMYFGSFSFINLDQLPALFRKIAANAVGASFKLAIDTINAQIGKIMGDFQAAVQALNSMTKNTCAAGTAIANSIKDPEARNSEWERIKSSFGEAVGKFESAWSATQELFKNKKAITDSKEDKKRLTRESPKAGNLAWKALLEGPAIDWMRFTGSDSTTDREVMMSIMGYDSIDIDGGTSLDFGPAILRLQDLRDGSSENKPLKRYTCSGDTGADGCLNPDLMNYPFSGVKGYVRQIIQGDDAAGNDIVTAFKTNSVTAQQKALLSYVSTPVLGAIRPLINKSPDAARTLLPTLTEIVTNEVMVSMGRSVRISAATMWKGVKTAKISEYYNETMSNIDLDLRAIEFASEKNAENLQAVRRVVEETIKSVGIPTWLGSGR